MAISLLDSTMFAGMFGDPELAVLFSDEAEIAAMILVERGLARAQARRGVIPAGAGAALDAAMADLVIPPAELAAPTASAGVPVPGLVAALRSRIDAETAQWLHWGATTQDIIDGGLVLRLRDVMMVMDRRLGRLIDTLLEAAIREADVVMAGRTRTQIATPITFGLRIAQWAQPLIDLAEMHNELKPRLLRVQFGGASGANTAVAPHGPAITAALAEELGLANAPPWHTSRVALAACADWHARLTGALGKIAGDLMLMGRSEIAEARAGIGGGSSTMPQKSNPVAAEAIATLARYAASLVAPMHLAASHLEERDGVSWSLEWLTLPQIIVSAGAASRHAQDLADSLTGDANRMRAALDLGGGAAMAEAASFALAGHMPRAEAQAVMKRAANQALASGESLARVLAGMVDVEVDWTEVLDPTAAAGASRDVIDMIAKRWRDHAGAS